MNGTVQMSVEISKREYEEAVASSDGIQVLAEKCAVEAGYHPAGYDCFNAAVGCKGSSYWIMWDRNRVS